MINYALHCRNCNALVQNNIDEIAYIMALIDEEKTACMDCGLIFVPEDSDYKGAVVALRQPAI